MCPTEDVGGLPSHENFLEAITDPEHPEHGDIMAWYGSDFDPNTPDTDELKKENGKSKMFLECENKTTSLRHVIYANICSDGAQ